MPPLNISIIALAPNDWQGTWMNRQQLLSRLAKRGFNVTYSTGCLSWWDRGSERWDKSKWFTRNIYTDGVTVDIPGKNYIRWPKCSLYDKTVIKKYVNRIKNKAGWKNKNSNIIKIAFIFHPCFYPYLEYLNSDYIVYHVYDLHSGMPGSSVTTELYEKKLIDRCDLLTVINQAIIDTFGESGKKKAKILGNGVDVDIFKLIKTTEPEDMRAIPSPRIGYAGTLNNKIDWEVIEYLAKKFPEWHWVFVGPDKSDKISDQVQINCYKRCLSFNNVHLLGGKKRLDVPNYVNNFDIGAICYRLEENGWSLFGSPLKLHEFLACGKPVVCSEMPSVYEFSDVIRISKTHDDWVRNIKNSLEFQDDLGDVERRIATARNNSWDSKVDILESLLFTMLKSNKNKI